MVAANPNHRLPPPRSPVPPTNWLVGPVRREDGTGHRPGPTAWESGGTTRRLAVQPPLSLEDLRIHAWLSTRLALLHYEQHGLWPRLRRLLFGDRLSWWLRIWQ
jgi:hypothetical protein